MVLFIENSRKCRVTYRDRKQMKGCLRVRRGEGPERGITKGPEETFGVMDVLTSLTVVMISCVHPDVNAYPTCTLKLLSLLPR